MNLRPDLPGRRAPRRWFGIALGFLVLSRSWSGAAPVGELPARPVFPLRVSADGRHLEGADATPFLVVGDTAWSLLAQLDEADTARYLDDRVRRGFNATIVSLIERKFATRAPANRAGVPPFLAAGDFTRPNPAYFDAAHRALAAANERGLSVWLCPAYLGWGGGDEGFFREIRAAGPAALRGYGRFVGARFKDLPNLVWMVGGDYALPEAERWAGAELALGLREGGAGQLITAHGGQTTAVQTYGDAPWLAVDTVYRYDANLWKAVQANRARQPVRPFVMIESTYEGEHNARPEQIRRQAWWSVLGGACGQFFGNNPVWHFDGPGLFPAAVAWPEALDSTGARDLGRLARFFAGRPWHRLEPDLEGWLVTGHRGEGRDYIAAAATRDRTLAVCYVASDIREPRGFTLDLSSFSGPVAARWFNPAQDVPWRPGPPLVNEPKQHLITPGNNGTGVSDWVLVLEPASAPDGATGGARAN